MTLTHHMQIGLERPARPFPLKTVLFVVLHVGMMAACLALGLVRHAPTLAAILAISGTLAWAGAYLMAMQGPSRN